MDEKTLKVLLTDTPVSEVRYYSETGSTNDLALQWLDSGAPDFALVAADRQTAGRGRMQRTWITNPGAALAFSLILHLDPKESKNAAMMPFIAGAGLSSALERLYSISPQVKWPNDILLEGKRRQVYWWNPSGWIVPKFLWSSALVLISRPDHFPPPKG